MSVSKGGRGIKAPYETTHVRIPVDIKDQVERLSQAFKEGITEKPSQPVSLDEALSIAKNVLRQKKSARVSIEKLLTSIYGVDVTL